MYKVGQIVYRIVDLDQWVHTGTRFPIEPEAGHFPFPLQILSYCTARKEYQVSWDDSCPEGFVEGHEAVFSLHENEITDKVP